MNIHQEVDERLIEMRKSGYSCQQLLDYFMNREPMLDELISLNHVARVCFEHGLPFSEKQLLKLFNKLYVPVTKEWQTSLKTGKKYSIQGSKNDCWNFLKTFSGKKLIKFIPDVPKKVHSLHGGIQNQAVLVQDNSKQVSLYPPEQNTPSNSIKHGEEI